MLLGMLVAWGRCMSPAVTTSPRTSIAGGPCAPVQSKLFNELLGPNHDAWRVVRKERAFSFYREIAHDHPRLPFGSIVLTTEPGRPQTFDFYSGRGKHSLLETFGDEVPRAAQILMDREHIISLFTKCAVDMSRSNWDHHLSFSGDQLKERCAILRHGSPIFNRLVGVTHSRFIRPAGGREEISLPRNHAGLVVSQIEHDVPSVRCLISYPRTIETTFFSSRLTAGLNAITGEMVELITELNRSVDGRGFLDSGEF